MTNGRYAPPRDERTFIYVANDIPADLTIAAWRLSRMTRERRTRRRVMRTFLRAVTNGARAIL